MGDNDDLDHRPNHRNIAESETFECFLSHNSRDKPAVRTLTKQLRARGISVWLDEEQLRPGVPWQPLLESGIRASHSVVVLVGADGLGPWEDMEMQAALMLAVRDRLPVIPVLLPDAPAEPVLPLFLQAFTWVDLRQQTDSGTLSGLERLIWGITGRRSGGLDDHPGRVPRDTKILPAQLGHPRSQEAALGRNGDQGRDASLPIVSLWRDRGGQDFICGGVLLSRRHVLTVRHAFPDAREGQTVYLGLVPGTPTEPLARVRAFYADPDGRTLDAAILEVETALGYGQAPRFHTEADRATLTGRPAALWVVDPDHFGWHEDISHSIGSYDDATWEYVLNPEVARGYSGGAVVVDGRVVGLLSRRKVDDPICRMVPMHLLWPWIQAELGDAFTPPGPLPPAPAAPVSNAYLALLTAVRQRVCDLLTGPAAALVPHWTADPLAGFDPADRANQLRQLLFDLHRATEPLTRNAPRRRPGDKDALRKVCRELLGALVKLAVDPGAGEEEIRAVAAGRSDSLYLACRLPGTADVVYCALANLNNLLERRPGVGGLASDHSVYVSDLLPAGTGRDLYQAILQKLWCKALPRDAAPAVIDPDHTPDAYHTLLAAIRTRRDRDGLRFVLVAEGPREWCEQGDYRQWADRLGLGLVLREQGQCVHLLLEEHQLIHQVRDYLALLEDL